MTIQPTAVYKPGTSPASSGQQRFYQTYNTRYANAPTGPPPNPPGGGGSTPAPKPNRLTGYLWNRIPSAVQRVNVPNGVPRFLGARPLIFWSWGLAILMVSFDEWHTYGILPRPARLWYTSLLFLLLAIVSQFDAMVPITNAFAIGMIMVLAYQYYTGEGQFGPRGAQEASTPATKTQPAFNATQTYQGANSTNG